MANPNWRAIQALMQAHNNALRRRQQAREAAGNALMATCMGNMCLNFAQPRRTPNQQRLRNAGQRANRNYNQAYERLKRALRQNVYVNENNIYNLNRPRNYLRPTSNRSWNIRHVRAAATIQRHVRGTQQRAKTGINNPYTNIGKQIVFGRIMYGPKVFSAVRRIQTAVRARRARRNTAARRIQSAYRKHRAGR
jgi:hypothetical protein